MKNGWRPLSEAPDDEVLITNGKHVAAAFPLDSSKDEWVSGDTLVCWRPIAWQPFPAPETE